MSSVMNIGFLVLGVVLLFLVMVDLLWTTIWIEAGAGPFTSRLMSGTWQTIRRVGRDKTSVLTLSGPVILVIGLGTWIVLLWGGWTFVLAGGETALIDTLERGPISWSDRIYFAGYAIFTMGNGDFAPREGVWQIISTLASASGLLFITLSVTYVLSVLDAVTQKRSFASKISGLGSEGTEILQTSWNGEAFEGLEVPFDTIASEVNALTSNHKAYPILHYYYSRQAEQAPASRIAVLDEALTLFRFGVAKEVRPPRITVEPVRFSVQNYLSTVHESFIPSADRTPPDPDLQSLRTADIPTVSDEEFGRSITTLEKRRRLLLGLVDYDVRTWPSGDG